jgi:lipid II:glycine glycyltransferase (peptidoglycan interpeptide bridge formation enzyme)
MAQVTLSDPNLKEFIAERGKDILYFDQAWLDLITSSYGYTFIPLTTTNSSGQLTGFLPLLSINSSITGRRLVSLPFSDQCPLIANDEQSANELVDQAIQLAKDQRVRYLELRTGFHEVLAQRQDLTASKLYVRWVTPLSPNPDTSWSHLRPTARRKVKKARSLGVQTRIAERREDMLEYYRLHLYTRSKKHGMPSQPLSFFLHLWDNFALKGQLHLEIAEFEGKVIAAHITSFYGQAARYLYGASDEKYGEMAAGYLLTWDSIAWGCTHGYQSLDLGRTAQDNSGLMQFKRSWGAVEEPIPYYYYPTINGLAATSENSRKYQLLTRCWRNLPLGISAPLGGYLYRHLG